MTARRALRLGFTLLVFALLAVALVDQWHTMRSHIGDLTPGGLLGAFVLLVLSLVASVMTWRELLADMGTRIPVRVASRVFFLGQLAKYVPGSVWTVLASMELGRDHQIPRQQSAAASLLIFPLNTAVAVVIGAATLPFVYGGGARQYAWVLLAVPVCLGMLHPRLLTPLLNRLARVFKRQPLATAPSVRGLVRAGAWSTLSCLLAGSHVFLLARDLGATGPRVLVLAWGAWATAWAVGFVLIIFPAGIGPREVALVKLMEPVLATGAGSVLVITSRLLLAVAEVVVALAAAGVVWLVQRSSRRNRAAGAQHLDPIMDNVDQHSLPSE